MQTVMSAQNENVLCRSNQCLLCVVTNSIHIESSNIYMHYKFVENWKTQCDDIFKAFIMLVCAVFLSLFFQIK